MPKNLKLTPIKSSSSCKTVDETIGEIFNMSKLSDAQKYVLRNLCLFPDTGIKGSLFAEWTGLDTLNDVNKLEKSGWITFDTEKNTIALHQVIADICLKKLEPNGESCKKLLSVLACDLEDINVCLLHGNIDDIENLYLSVALKIQGDSKEITALRTKTLNFFSGQMYDEQTKAIYEVWEDTCRELYGEYSKEIAHVYTVRDKTSHLVKALEIYDKLEVDNEYEVEKIYIWSNLAFYVKNNDVSLYNRAMENINKFIDNDTQMYGVKAAYAYLKVAYLFSQAELHEKLLIKARNSIYDIKNSNSVHAAVIHSFAFHYAETERYAEAIELYQKVIDISLEIKNLDKDFLIIPMKNMGQVHEDNNDI